jgi:hypothetical protein
LILIHLPMLGRVGWLVRWSRLIFGYVAGQYELFAGWRSIDYQPGGADDCESKNIFIGFKQAMSAMTPTQTQAMIIKPSM